MPKKILLNSGINSIFAHNIKHKNNKGKDPIYKIKYKNCFLLIIFSILLIIVL